MPEIDGSSVPRGLTSAEAQARLEREGRNSIPAAPPRGLHQRLLAQLENALTLLLLAAAVLDLALWIAHGSAGFPVEPAAIFTVLALNAALGILQEYRSERALGALRSLGQPTAWTLRDAGFVQIPAEELVAGDVVRLEAGDRVPADGLVLEPTALAVDESMLTGESIPIDKTAGDGASSGTLVVRGTALLRITATGERSALGKLASELSSIETGRTPLEERMDAFGRRIAWVAFAIVTALIGLGLLSEGWQRVGEVATFAIAFAVAIVPEGMPAVVTLALALGVERMARRRAVVRRMAAVEALGSVTVIATDKTGTLTENRATVAGIFAQDELSLVEAAVLANDADPAGTMGDPLDLALLAYARVRGVDVARLRAEHPRVSSRPFDASWRYARVTVEDERGRVSYLKGAVEELTARSCADAAEKARLVAVAEREAALGRRVIAVARARGESEHDLELLGLIAVWDPPREGVEKAVAAVLGAGIRVLMVTGDHPATARAVAESVGLASPVVLSGEELRALSVAERVKRLGSADCVARATAEDKLLIVEALQESGAVVAMTGDGVNDAPALKRANVGVAMGQRGSDVAREVSDLVLLDDDFSTIERAVDEGRNIYDNIQKFLRFTFSTNVALAILALGGALGSYLLGLRDHAGALIVPLSAIQILFINFVGDGAPALALAVDRNPSVMRRRPRPATAALLDGPAIRFIAVAGTLQGTVGLGLLALLPRFGFEVEAIQTLVFLYESAAKVLSVYPARRASGEPASNRALHAAAVLGIALSLACVYTPGLRSLLDLTTPSADGWIVILACVLATSGATELLVPLGRRLARWNDSRSKRRRASLSPAGGKP